MTVRDEAFRYLKMGWSVIPLQPRSKMPAGPWAQFSNRLMQPGEVASEFPDASNIGIVTGRISGIVVIDVDPGRGGDADWVLKRFPTGRIVRTGGGGTHLYYRYPAAGHVGNMVDVYPGIDIRADGGQVVAPPSVHASGSRYAWIHEGPLTEFPREFVKKGGGTKSAGKEGWAIALLESGAEEGTRDDSAAKLSGLLARHQVPEEIAIRLLRSWNEARNKTPLPNEDIDKTVKSVYRTDSRRRTAEGSSDSFKLISFDEFMSLYMREDMEWLVKGWVPDKTVLFVVAAPESWKTWMTFDLAMAVATGRKFLQKYDVQRTGPVVIVQQEDFNGQTAQRLSVIAYGDGLIGTPTMVGERLVVPALPSIPIHIHPDRKLRFDDPESIAGLRLAIESVKPALVIIDPLYSTAGTSTEGFMATLPSLMSPIKDMRDTFGCSFVFVHHAKKNSEGSDRERAWGSQLLNAFMEAGWQLQSAGPRGSGKVQVSRHFKSAPAQPDVVLTFDVNTNDNGYQYKVTETTPEGVAQGQVSDMEALILKLAARPQGMSISEVAQGTGKHRSSCFRKIQTMFKNGQLQYLNGDQTKYVLPPAVKPAGT